MMMQPFYGQDGVRPAFRQARNSRFPFVIRDCLCWSVVANTLVFHVLSVRKCTLLAGQ